MRTPEKYSSPSTKSPYSLYGSPATAASTPAKNFSVIKMISNCPLI